MEIRLYVHLGHRGDRGHDRLSVFRHEVEERGDQVPLADVHGEDRLVGHLAPGDLDD
ncbi:MAG: hypothetical protein ACRDZ6_10645 [Acidimicrobiales bacterium]